jgi:hypothetical protein
MVIRPPFIIEEKLTVLSENAGKSYKIPARLFRVPLNIQDLAGGKDSVTIKAVENRLIFETVGGGEWDVAPVQGILAADQTACHQDIHRLADRRTADLFHFCQFADRGQASSDVPQDMELFDADIVIFHRNGTHIPLDPIPDGRDGAPERLNDCRDQLFSCIIGYQHICLGF